MSAIRGTTPSVWQRTRETRVAYAFLLPVLVLFIVFRIGPALASFVLSFLRYRISGNSRFLGLANYQRLLDDGNFWQSLKVTAIYTVIAVPLVSCWRWRWPCWSTAPSGDELLPRALLPALHHEHR